MKPDKAARIFAELGNRTRLDILRLLIRSGDDGLAIGEIQERLDIPPSTLAFHIRGLVSAGLITQEKARTGYSMPALLQTNQRRHLLSQGIVLPWHGLTRSVPAGHLHRIFLLTQ